MRGVASLFSSPQNVYRRCGKETWATKKQLRNRRRMRRRERCMMAENFEENTFRWWKHRRKRCTSDLDSRRMTYGNMFSATFSELNCCSSMLVKLLDLLWHDTIHFDIKLYSVLTCLYTFLLHFTDIWLFQWDFCYMCPYTSIVLTYQHFFFLLQSMYSFFYAE